ncbi:ceramide synthase 5-like [Saccostrea echinata]|uniref:ceramide synthase 5-like n=1 Tax=Saccostrea echinata TaxID=191078 RepID=UPI002A7F8670|nr:ceramide synthase 5-like [Saccostrea echinata]
MEILWNEKFWFPKGVTWKDMQNVDPKVYIPQIEDIGIFSIVVGLVLLITRFLTERLIVIPLAKCLGVKVRKNVQLTNIPELEQLYKRKKNDARSIKEVAKKTDLSERQVHHWLRKRAKKDSPSTMQKFTECSYHFMFYCTMFVYGLYILWDKSWFWETKYCWIDWPKQNVTRGVYWYYIIELGFYWSLTFTLLIDHKRKDFKEMVVHHLVTMTLMYFSWVCNFVRVGTLVLLVHDAVDYWMAAAKMAKYCKRQTLCEIFFVVFVIVWILTRLMIYPLRVLYTSSIEYYEYLDYFPSAYLFNALLIVLQILHILWTFMIIKIILQKFTEGELKKDSRSDSESDTDDGDTTASEEASPQRHRMVTRQRANIMNGTT